MNNPVVLDNTVLTNFALVNRADLTLQLWPGAACITPTVCDEFQIAVENQGLPANCWAGLPVIELNEAETQLAENLPRNLDPGERTCLALAINRKGLLASDDLAARRTAASFNVPTTGTIGVLAACVKLGFLTKDEGDGLLLQMIAAGYYSPFESLNDLLR